MWTAAPLKNKKNVMSLCTVENSRKVTKDALLIYSVKKWKLVVLFKTQVCTSKVPTEVQS